MLSDICQEFKVIVKVAELAITCKEAVPGQMVRLKALEDLCALQIPACYWHPISLIIYPVLPNLIIESSVLHDLSQQMCTAKIYFDDKARFSEIFQLIGQRAHLTATTAIRTAKVQY